MIAAIHANGKNGLPIRVAKSVEQRRISRHRQLAAAMCELAASPIIAAVAS